MLVAPGELALGVSGPSLAGACVGCFCAAPSTGLPCMLSPLMPHAQSQCGVQAIPEPCQVPFCDKPGSGWRVAAHAELRGWSVHHR